MQQSPHMDRDEGEGMGPVCATAGSREGLQTVTEHETSTWQESRLACGVSHPSEGKPLRPQRLLL